VDSHIFRPFKSVLVPQTNLCDSRNLLKSHKIGKNAATTEAQAMLATGATPDGQIEQVDHTASNQVLGHNKTESVPVDDTKIQSLQELHSAISKELKIPESVEFKSQDPKKEMVVQSICNGDQQTMPNMQQTLDYRTVSAVACPMPDMLKEENKKKTITIFEEDVCTESREEGISSAFTHALSVFVAEVTFNALHDARDACALAVQLGDVTKQSQQNFQEDLALYAENDSEHEEFCSGQFSLGTMQTGSDHPGSRNSDFDYKNDIKRTAGTKKWSIPIIPWAHFERICPTNKRNSCGGSGWMPKEKYKAKRTYASTPSFTLHKRLARVRRESYARMSTSAGMNPVRGHLCRRRRDRGQTRPRNAHCFMQSFKFWNKDRGDCSCQNCLDIDGGIEEMRIRRDSLLGGAWEYSAEHASGQSQNNQNISSSNEITLTEEQLQTCMEMTWRAQHDNMPIPLDFYDTALCVGNMSAYDIFKMNTRTINMRTITPVRDLDDNVPLSARAHSDDSASDSRSEASAWSVKVDDYVLFGIECRENSFINVSGRYFQPMRVEITLSNEHLRSWKYKISKCVETLKVRDRSIHQVQLELLAGQRRMAKVQQLLRVAIVAMQCVNTFDSENLGDTETHSGFDAPAAVIPPRTQPQGAFLGDSTEIFEGDSTHEALGLGGEGTVNACKFTFVQDTQNKLAAEESGIKRLLRDLNVELLKTQKYAKFIKATLQNVQSRFRILNNGTTPAASLAMALHMTCDPNRVDYIVTTNGLSWHELDAADFCTNHTEINVAQFAAIEEFRAQLQEKIQEQKNDNEDREYFFTKSECDALNMGRTFTCESFIKSKAGVLFVIAVEKYEYMNICDDDFGDFH